MIFKVDTTKAKLLLQQMPRGLQRAITVWVSQFGQYTAGEMRKQIRDRVRRSGASLRPSGQTARSVKVLASGDGYAVIGPEVRMTPWGEFDPIWLDQPTRPHEIRPRFKKALAFSSLGGTVRQRGDRFVSLVRIGVNRGGRARIVVGDVTYAKVVHHPGTRGIFFVDATMARIEPEGQRLLDRLVDDELRRLKGR